MNDAQYAPFSRLRAALPEIQEALRELKLDGWLLYDLHARNPASSGLLGLGDLSRRWFVLIRPDADPVAIAHGIELAPWEGWPWELRRYVGWRELEEALALIPVGGRLAMEISPRDAVPAVDLIPAGVVELVRAAGAEVVTSGDLVTRFHARWSEAALASHRKASAELARVARRAFERAADVLRTGETVREGELRNWILDQLAAKGLSTGADCIVAGGVRAADPHYHITGPGGEVERGDVMLLDLWAKADSPDAVFADQTWMAFFGDAMTDRLAGLWAAVRDARDAAVNFLQNRWMEGTAVRGHELDDAARNLIAGRGHGGAFIHRTGHSIDQATHGMGPNLDNYETRELRLLIPGIGFSVEPGIYLPGEVGLRSEINVYLSESGPEVTTPEPQSEMYAPFLA